MILLTITKVIHQRGPRFAAACVLAMASAAAQMPDKPCTATTEHPCPARPAPSTAEQFPFPGEQEPPKQPAPTAAEKQLTPSPPAPAKPSTAERFPFPGEPESPAPSSQEPSSSSSSSSSSTPDDTPDPEPAPAETDPAKMTRTQRRHLPKVEDLDAREAKDLEVSHFYFTTGNFRAAYLRAQDAVRIIPDDPEAHFALAESASRLKNFDEAVAEYKLCLKLDPDGLKAKAARQALLSMKRN